MESSIDLLFPAKSTFSLPDRLSFGDKEDGKLTVLVQKSAEVSHEIVSSLLFQMALSFNSKPPYGKVTILTKSAWSSKPKSIQEMPPDSYESLSLLTFTYAKSFEDILKHLSKLLSIVDDARKLPDLAIFDLSSHHEGLCPRKISKILTLIREISNGIECTKKIQCIVALPVTSPSSDSLVTKLHFFANEVWSIQDPPRSLSFAHENSAFHFEFTDDVNDDNCLVLKNIWKDDLKAKSNHL